jgi:hypothetical protein
MLPRSIGIFKPYYQKGGKRKPARLAKKKKERDFLACFLVRIVFFFNNKSGNGTFNHDFSAKRTSNLSRTFKKMTSTQRLVSSNRSAALFFQMQHSRRHRWDH